MMRVWFMVVLTLVGIAACGPATVEADPDPTYCTVVDPTATPPAYLEVDNCVIPPGRG